MTVGNEYQERHVALVMHEDSNMTLISLGRVTPTIRAYPQVAGEDGDYDETGTNTTASKVYVICKGPHVFYEVCPKKDKVGRILTQDNIGYSHTARW